MSTEVFDY